MEEARMPITPETPSLIDECQRMLVKRRGKHREIAKVTGYSYAWIHKLGRGQLKNPSYLRLKRLMELFASGVI
jgi:predicted transcriptional regulator